jgi:hypothetical protein
LVDRGGQVLHTQQRLSGRSIDALTRQAFDIPTHDDERDGRQRGADCEHGRAGARGAGA